MSPHPPQGTIHSINVSGGGVPKRPVESAEVTSEGLTTDRQANQEHHGGPQRAVCLLGLDAIERLRAEGHPIEPGTTGENLTLSGLDWAAVVPGARLGFEHGVELELLSYASPCSTIRASFVDGEFMRMHADTHPAESRLYARVVRSGTLRQGETCELRPATNASDEGASA